MKLLATLLLVVAIVLAALLLLNSGNSTRRSSVEELGPASQEAPTPARSGSSELSLEPGRDPALPVPTERNTIAYEAAPKKVVRHLQGALIAHGRPMKEGRVEIHIGERVVAEARTNDFGRFQIHFVQEPEEAELVTIARGFVPLRQPLGFKQVGSTESLGNLRLMWALPLPGQVLSPQGRPLAGARVEIGLGIQSAQRVDLETVTDDNGEFLFREAPRGQIVITASKEGFGARRMEHSHGSTFPVEIKLRRGHLLRLRVTDELGRPLEGAEIEISASDPGAPAQRELSDREGRAVFPDLGSSMWNAKVRKPDHRPANGFHLMADGSEHVIEVPRWPGITGTVLVPEGSALPPDARVFALPSSSPSDRLLGTGGGWPVDATGRFRVGGLRPGFYRIHIRASGFAPYDSEPFQIALDGDHEFGRALLEIGGKVQLYCTAGGRPLSGVHCEVRTSRPRPGEVWAPMLRRVEALPETDGKGLIAFDGLSGTVWVLLKKEGFLPVVKGPLRTRDDDRSIVSVPMEPGGVLFGKVVDQLGRLQSGVRVRITEESERIGVPIFLNSKPDGRYRSIALPPGAYRVETLTGSQGSSAPEQTIIEPGKENRLDLKVTKAQ